MNNQNDNHPIAQEYFGAKFQLNESDPDSGTFKGIASVFGSMVELWLPTVIVKGAFKKTIKENGKRFRILYQHDSWEPLARPGIGLNEQDALEETDEGLLVGAKISKTVRGMDTITLLRDRVIDELSIGWDPVRTEMMPLNQVLSKGLLLNPDKFKDWSHSEKIRVVREAKLWEASLVTFAADPAAKVTTVHNLQKRIATLPLDTFAALILPGDEERDESKDIPSLDDLASILLETHEAKALSDNGRKLISDAISALQALAAAAEQPAPPVEDAGTQALTANVERMNRLREADFALANY